MAADDEYPRETGRRRFVKGVVEGTVLTSVGTTAMAAAETTTVATGTDGGRIGYVGIENVAGPAPRAMPQIPITIDDEGFLEGVWPDVRTVTDGGREVTIAEMDLGGITYSSEWFQYCGIQTAPGIRPTADQNDAFRSAPNPPYAWQREAKSEDDKIHVDDFTDYETWENGIGTSGMGKSANALW